jgi:(1->4)-alpha-D-glucan 1-alpha-D-glucosylmutase
LRDVVAEKVPGANPAYTLVEKILAPGEEMPKAWEIHGTSGYEFAGNLIELFLDRADESAWSRIYGDFTGDTQSSRDLTYRDKIFILEEMFHNAVSNLAVELDSLIEHDWQWRDLSLHDLKTGLRHLLACLPVYRTYRMPGEKMVEEERKWVRQAVEEGLRRNPSVDPEPIRFLGRVIMGDYPPVDILSEYRESFDRWVCKLEQVTGAIMAKSVEDTHFYRYVRMLATNEVGSHPSRFGQPVAEFHRSNRLRQQQMPFCLLTTSTHDTKVSEDARARLFALAELPEEWETKLREWHGMNEKARTQIAEKTAPDEREQYMLYQMMLAAWPLGASMADDAFRQRIKSYFRKAQGEAKLNTAWTFPHEPWHEAGGKFLDAILSSESFLKSFVPFAERVARRGMIYSLGQTVLKLTSPGVPDIYQGNEVWDFSLVDPDNRRPVDYELRRGLLSGLDKRTPKDLWTNWKDGGIKMQTVRAILRCRTDFPELFTRGEYTPLTPEGEDADRVVSFMRSHGGRDLLVVAARRLGTNDASWVGGSWKGIRLPELKRRGWSNLLTGAAITAPSEGLAVAELFADWPVAVLLSDAE